MQPTSFPFGKEVQSYRQHEVVTPFQTQSQRYDRPIGQMLYYAYIWRIVFFAVMVVSIFLGFILIATLNASPYKILIEQVTNKGYLKSPPVLLSPNYEVTPAVLSAFVKKMLTDESVYNSNDHFASDEALRTIQNIPEEIKAKLLTSRFIHFRINKTHFSGRVMDENNTVFASVAGTFSHKILDKSKDVDINPLGIYIDRVLIQE